MVNRLGSGGTHAAAAFLAREPMAITAVAHLLSAGRFEGRRWRGHQLCFYSWPWTHFCSTYLSGMQYLSAPVSLSNG